MTYPTKQKQPQIHADERRYDVSNLRLSASICGCLPFPALRAAAAALALAGCGGLVVNLPVDAPASQESLDRPHELRFRREKGSLDRYQASYRMRVRNGYQVDEDVTALLVYYYTGKTPGPEVFDRVIIRRKEQKRSFLEVMPDGKASRKDATRDRQPLVTPNVDAEAGTEGLRYVPFDELGRIGRRPETPFHYVWYDSLCYLFPVLPGKAAMLGDRWPYDLPVIVGREFNNNRIALHASFRLADLRRLQVAGGRPGPLVAVIEYTYYGLLDTAAAEDADKMPEGAVGLVWRRNVVEGEGLVYFEIERGRIVWKHEKYTVTIEGKTVAPEKRKRKEEEPGFFDGPRSRTRPEPGLDHQHFTWTLEFTARLLGPAELATDRPSRVQ